MIKIETLQEGFVLLVEGRKVLSHSRRSPCVEIGRAENIVKQSKASFRLRRKHVQGQSLRGFKIVENGPDFVAIDFEGRLRMAASLKDGALHISFSRYDSSVNLFRLRLAAQADERIYGCGERYSRLDLKLSRVPLWVEDRGLGRGRGLMARIARRASGASGDRNSTYFPVPAFISSKNYWCAIDTSSFVTIDFRRTQTLVDAWAVPRELVVGSGKGAPESLGGMTAAIGRQPPPPSWCYDGALLGLVGGGAAIERKLRGVLDAGAKVSAVWASDWCGRRGQGRMAAWDAPSGAPSGLYEAAEGHRGGGALYPDLERDIAGLRARGIRFLGYINPLLSTEGELYAQASAEGLCVKDREGRDYIVSSAGATSALVDLSSAQALAWLKGTIKRELLERGMSGWMADGGECLPTDAVLASGESALLAHNRWPLLWAQANREAIEEFGAVNETIFFVRSGWLGSSKQAQAVWAGDQLVDFSREDGLASVVPAGLSLGLSGIGFWHSDVGGSSSFAWLRRSPECLGRWTEMAAFTPFFRSSEGLRPEGNAQFWRDAASLALFARMSEVYAELKPYHISVAAEYLAKGLPPLRHPWIHYEDDARTHRLTYQYLYGRDLMVAPVVEAARALTELYLPEDEWVHLWSSRVFRRGMVQVESPPGCPAVFYRASSPFASLFDAIRRTVRRL